MKRVQEVSSLPGFGVKPDLVCCFDAVMSALFLSATSDIIPKHA
jgi:hypothetical protein